MLNDLNFITDVKYKANVDGKLGVALTLTFVRVKISTTRKITFEFEKEDGDSVYFDTAEVIHYFGVQVEV